MNATALAFLASVLAGIAPAAGAAQTVVLNSDTNLELEIRVQGAPVGAPVMLVGYVTLRGSSSSSPPPLTSVLSEVYPVVVEAPASTAAYVTAWGPGASPELATAVNPSGGTFPMPAWTVQRTLQQVPWWGAHAPYTQTVPSGGTLSWQSQPPGWTPGETLIPWWSLGLGGGETTVFDLEQTVRAFLANQFAYLEGGVYSPLVELEDYRVEQIIGLIRDQEITCDLNVQALVLSAPAAGSSTNKPSVTIAPSLPLQIILSDDPGAPRPIVRQILSGCQPYQYPGMPGAKFLIELREPIANESQLARLRLVLPRVGSGDGVMLEVSGYVGDAVIECVVPSIAVSGPGWVLDIGPNTAVPLATPCAAPTGWFHFLRVYP